MISCLHCSFEFAVTPNAYLVVFDPQPWFSYLQATCPRCLLRSMVFFGPVDYQLQINKYFEDGLVIFHDRFPTKDITDWWETTYDRHELSERALPPSLLNLCQLWATVLDTIPDELFWEMMRSPEMPHLLPELWT